MEPLETLTVIYRQALPWLMGLAVLGWLAATPLPARELGAKTQGLWLLAGVLLLLVLSRLGLLSVIHVTSWSSVSDIRYLSAAQPLLVFFYGDRVVAVEHNLAAHLKIRCRHSFQGKFPMFALVISRYDPWQARLHPLRHYEGRQFARLRA